MSDVGRYMQNVVAEQRAQRFRESPQLSLGKLIKALKEVEDQDRILVFEFADLAPGELNSWRGSYDELSIDPTRPAFPNVTRVGDYVQYLLNAYERYFKGYKGGVYVMGPETPIWVAEYGHVGNTALVGVREQDYKVVLLTDQLTF